MNKSIIAACVGGVIIFFWQFLSWGPLNLHQPAQKYTPKQEAILSFLDQQGLEEGGYYMPGTPEGASIEEYDRIMKEAAGKPWATIQYHHQQNSTMGMNMMRGVLVNIVMVLLLCWIISFMRTPRFATIFLASLFTGLIVFLNEPYTTFIWFKTFDLWASLSDAVISWGLCGLWLAFYLGHKQQKTVISTRRHRATTMNLE